MSNQATWQQKQVAAGRCRRCGKKRKQYSHCCNACAAKERVYQRNNYRTKVGIPLDAPLSTRGRPKLGKAK